MELNIIIYQLITKQLLSTNCLFVLQIYFPFSPKSLFHFTLGSGEPGSQFSMPITKLGEKKYYLGIFFKVKTLSPKLTEFMFERKMWKPKLVGFFFTNLFGFIKFD